MPKELLVSVNELKSVIKDLKDNQDYNLLLDITCIDYLKFPDVMESRFALVYILRDRTFKKEIIVKTFIPDHNLIVESISDLYYAADWAEREVYDQYGIKFKGHKNLKRVLNHHQFIGHPLRKDYPITKGQICTETEDLMDEMMPLLKSKGFTKYGSGDNDLGFWMWNWKGQLQYRKTPLPPNYCDDGCRC